MSSPTSPPVSHGRGHRAITFLFTLSVVVFLLAGLAIVIGQAVILAGGDATGARPGRQRSSRSRSAGHPWLDCSPSH